MLEKMGWKKGEGLGKEGTGMKDPVRRVGRFSSDKKHFTVLPTAIAPALCLL